jgi:hypothetical protein
VEDGSINPKDAEENQLNHNIIEEDGAEPASALRLAISHRSPLRPEEGG